MANEAAVTPPKRAKSGLFYGYVVVAAAFLIFIVLDGTMYSFGVFFKPLSDEFGWTRAMTSGAYSLFQFLLGFFLLITGRLNDRFGPRIVMTVCGFLLGLGYALMYFIGSVWQLYLFYGVIAAMGMGGGIVPLPSTIARWFVKRRGIMTGLAISGIGIGIIVVPPLSTQLIASFGWRYSYLITGAVAGVLLIFLGQFLRHEPAQMGQLPYGADEESKAARLKTSGLTLAEAIHTRQFWMLGMLYFFASYTNMAIMAHIVPHATDLGHNAAIAATILSVIGGISIIGRIGIGSVIDRIGTRQSQLISFIALVACFLWLFVTREMWAFYFFAVLFGFAYGSKVVLMSPSVAEFFGLKAHGAILGAIAFLNGAGGGFGPLVTGWIFDTTGDYTLAWLVCAIAGVIGLALTWLLKPINKPA
ncbi:MAG: MFS transporter [Dehalococcoidales bacterium]|nr:MFS transporter [Dehalococcoidales bacterium]